MLFMITQAILLSFPKFFSVSLFVVVKYGMEEREKDGRSFTDMDELSLVTLAEEIGELEISEMWNTVDKRPDRDEQRLNVILKKRL
ncbi:hypothetical protein Sbal223_2349 [Shewanella baltica OS223]|nr:hypothetical protein Sbal223_2349 [Shewanella baltica OS223]